MQPVVVRWLLLTIDDESFRVRCEPGKIAFVVVDEYLWHGGMCWFEVLWSVMAMFSETANLSAFSVGALATA